MTIKIPLSNKGGLALFAVISDEDLPIVSGSRWSYSKSNRGGEYAHCYRFVDGKWRTVYMHRLLLDAPKGLEVDHKDGDGLNNQRHNLRLATRSQNEQNKQGVRSDSTTGYRGVSESRAANAARPFQAYLYLMKKKKSLGWFATAEEANEAAKDGRRRLMTHAAECEEVV